MSLCYEKDSVLVDCNVVGGCGSSLEKLENYCDAEDLSLGFNEIEEV